MVAGTRHMSLTQLSSFWKISIYDDLWICVKFYMHYRIGATRGTWNIPTIPIQYAVLSYIHLHIQHRYQRRDHDSIISTQH